LGVDEDTWKALRVAKKIASGSAPVIREYIDEMRKRGRITGELSIVVRDGKRERQLPYISFA
jgi:hypothetical protein